MQTQQSYNQPPQPQNNMQSPQQYMNTPVNQSLNTPTAEPKLDLTSIAHTLQYDKFEEFKQLISKAPTDKMSKLVDVCCELNQPSYAMHLYNINMISIDHLLKNLIRWKHSTYMVENDLIKEMTNEHISYALQRRRINVLKALDESQLSKIQTQMQSMNLM
jgi:hypothetical protein